MFNKTANTCDRSRSYAWPAGEPRQQFTYLRSVAEIFWWIVLVTYCTLHLPHANGNVHLPHANGNVHLPHANGKSEFWQTFSKLIHYIFLTRCSLFLLSFKPFVAQISTNSVLKVSPACFRWGLSWSSDFLKKKFFNLQTNEAPFLNFGVEIFFLDARTLLYACLLYL